MELLNRIQQKLHAPKGQYNSFGKYNYRSCEDILSAIKPLLEAATLTITDEIVLIGDRYYVRAVATLSDGTATVSTTAYAREEESKKGMDGSQVTGAASSYARKYALNGMFCIDDTKDADTMDNANTPAKPAKSKPPQDIGGQFSAMLRKFGITSGSESWEKARMYVAEVAAHSGTTPEQIMERAVKSPAKFWDAYSAYVAKPPQSQEIIDIDTAGLEELSDE